MDTRTRYQADRRHAYVAFDAALGATDTRNKCENTTRCRRDERVGGRVGGYWLLEEIPTTYDPVVDSYPDDSDLP
jgi:hypothetical protein